MNIKISGNFWDPLSGILNHAGRAAGGAGTIRGAPSAGDEVRDSDKIRTNIMQYQWKLRGHRSPQFKPDLQNTTKGKNFKKLAELLGETILRVGENFYRRVQGRRVLSELNVSRKRWKSGGSDVTGYF